MTLDLDESVFVDGGSLAMFSYGIEPKAHLYGGAVKSLVRRKLANESMFMIRCLAHVHGAWVRAAPQFPGDVKIVPMHGDNPLMVESGSLLAFSEDVSLKTRYAGLSNIVLHEGAAAILCEGTGTLLVCAYGGIDTIELADDMKIFVDTGYLVAWGRDMGFRVGPMHSLVQADLTHEGMIAELTGPGVVYTQSRAQHGLKTWMLPALGPNASDHLSGR